MVVITLTDCPISLRGDLTKWLLEINTGVFVGRISTRARENLWLRILNNLKHGHATMVYNAQNEQGMEFKVVNTTWEPIDFEGVKLILRPSPARISKLNDNRKPGYSKASRNLLAKRLATHKADQTVKKPSCYAVIDVETTALTVEKGELFELAAIVVNEGKVLDTFTAQIKIQNPLPTKIAALTGVSDADLTLNGITLESAMPDFLAFIKDLPLVAHNIEFDVKFINHACDSLNMPEVANRQIDTLQLARRLLPQIRQHKLKTLAEYFKLEMEPCHRALADCYATYLLYEKLTNLDNTK